MRRGFHFIVGIVFVAGIVAGVAQGANKKAPPKPPLSEAGKSLEARFSAYLKALESKLEGALPALSEADKADFNKALAAEAAARGRLEKVQADIAHLNWARDMFARAKNVTLLQANKGIADCKAKEAKATSAAERMSAQKKREVWEQKKAKAEKEIGFFGKKIETLTPREPQYKKDLAETQSAYDKAKAAVLAVAGRTGVEKLLSSSTLDGDLAKYVIIQEATPYGLAEFAQKGKTQQALLAKLLTDKDLMIQIAVADGAKQAKYGRAMEIYTAIQKASDKAGDGVLQRLALAVALEHAVPIAQRNAEAQPNAPAVVDPLKRYLYNEKAYLDGELDPRFVHGRGSDADGAFAHTPERQLGELPTRVRERLSILLLPEGELERLNVACFVLVSNPFDHHRVGSIQVAHVSPHLAMMACRTWRMSMFTGQLRTHRPHPTQAVRPLLSTK